MSLRTTPLFPRLRWPLQRDDIAQLAKALDQLRDLLNRGLSYDLHLASRIIDVEIQAPTTAAPRKRLSFKKPPVGVVVLAYDRISGVPGSAQLAQPLRWSVSGQDLILDSLASLVGTDKYRLKLLVMEA